MAINLLENLKGKEKAMIIWDETLSDIVEDGNARRGWWMDLLRQQFDEYAHVEQMIDAIESEAVAA